MHQPSINTGKVIFFIVIDIVIIIIINRSIIINGKMGGFILLSCRQAGADTRLGLVRLAESRLCSNILRHAYLWTRYIPSRDNGVNGLALH